MLVRAPRPEDDFDVAALLCICSPGRASFLAGDPNHGVQFVLQAIRHPGNESSREVVSVVEADGRIAGAIAAFPADERHLRRRRLLLLGLRRRAAWDWPGMIRGSLSGLRRKRDLPAGTLYVDALATDAGFRRRGVATVLLNSAIDRARATGLTGIGLHTHVENHPARAFYTNAGFTVLAESTANELVLLYRRLEVKQAAGAEQP